MDNSTTPQDDAAMSPVSTGSLAHAWLVYAEDASESLFVTLRKEQADAAARDWGWGVAPLFVGLTQAEQDAIRLGELAYPGLRITDKGKFVDVWATLRGLVERQNRIVCDTKMDTTPGDGTEQRECTEPVAWLVEGCEYDTGCEFWYVALLKEQADAAAAAGARLTPLYRQPPPVAWQLVHECERLRDEVMMLRLTDQEREALWAIASHQLDDATFGKFAKILRRLFERTNVTEYPRSKLLPTVMPDELDAIIEGLERIKKLEAEVSRLRLTDAEREAVAYYVGTGGPDAIDAALRGLLERTK